MSRLPEPARHRCVARDKAALERLQEFGESQIPSVYRGSGHGHRPVRTHPTKVPREFPEAQIRMRQRSDDAFQTFAEMAERSLKHSLNQRRETVPGNLNADAKHDEGGDADDAMRSWLGNFGGDGWRVRAVR